MIFEIEVAFTDRSRDENGFITETTLVTVLAEAEDLAMLAAAQMVASRLPDDFMVTATATRII